MREEATNNEKKRKVGKFSSVEVGSLTTIHIQVAVKKPPHALGEPELVYNILLWIYNISSYDIPHVPQDTTGQAISTVQHH